MAHTMDWPPRLVNGRVAVVKGIDATTVLIRATLGDFTANPFTPEGTTLGDVVFESDASASAKIARAMRRVSNIAVVTRNQLVRRDGSTYVEIDFTEVETGDQSSVKVGR